MPTRVHDESRDLAGPPATTGPPDAGDGADLHDGLLARPVPDPLFGAPSAWRLEVLDAILRTLSVLGVLSLLVTTPVMFLDGQVALGLGYWGALALVLVMTAWRRAGFVPRLSFLLVIIYLTGLAIVIGEHRVPEFAVYMVAGPVLAALLGGMRWGVAALCVCGLTLLGVAWAAVTGTLPPAPPAATELTHLGNWITFGTNWALLTVLVGVSIWFVVARLERSLAEARALADDLEAQVEARKATQSQLLQAQKMEALGQLAGGVAHDFNNLLTVISFAAADAAETDDTETRRESLEMVRDAGTQGEQLVRQLLTLSRREVARPRSVDINALVADTVKVLERLLPRNIQVEVELADYLGPVWIDEVQLRQVLINLCLNARDAMLEGLGEAAGGRLTLRTRRLTGSVSGVAGDVLEDGPHVSVEVIDEGPGVPPELRSSIFDPFVTTKPSGKGTGLGLSTSLLIAREAGGTITLAPSSAHRGAAFGVVLPVQTGAVLPFDNRAPAPPLPPGLRVALVDDEPSVRSVLRSALQSLRAEVRDFASVEELRDRLDLLDGVDILVTDVVLTGAPGTELAAELFARHPEIVVLYCSGYAPDARVQADVDAGRAGFVQKPFTRASLADALARQRARHVEREATGDDSTPTGSTAAPSTRAADHRAAHPEQAKREPQR